MKKLVIATLAASTMLTGLAPAGLAAAQPGYHHYDDRRDGDRRYDDRRDHDRRDGDSRYDRRDHDRRDWDGDRRYDHSRWQRGHHFYGGRYGYHGYRGSWRTGQRYPHWRDNRYVISDYRAYRLPPPRHGYRYYRDDNGDIVMAAVTSGLIGLIVGSALND